MNKHRIKPFVAYENGCDVFEVEGEGGRGWCAGEEYFW